MHVNRLRCPIIVLRRSERGRGKRKEPITPVSQTSRSRARHFPSCHRSHFEDRMAPIRWKSVGAANATDSRPSSRNLMSRPASRQSARLARTSSSGGVGTPMVDEREVTETVAADVSPKKLSQSIKVEIKVENEVRLTRTGRGSRLLFHC